MKGVGQQSAGFSDALGAAVEEKTRNLQEVVHALQADNDEIARILENERSASRLKSQFVSLASHEFRTPLSSILLSASLIEQYYDRLDKKKIFSHLDRIKNAVNDLTGVLNDFLSVERIESGKVQAVYREFELNELCRSVIDEMQPLAKPAQVIYLESYIKQFIVYLDSNLLRHCLVNLVSNAIKYSAENQEVVITIQKKGKICNIAVKDNGIGIPGPEQNHLFEAFFRAGNVGDIPGTGLGLNIVKRYCDLMQMDITFSSSRTGTIFMLSFKL